MSGYPLVLDGAALSALVIGGGSVAERKVRSLLDAGASVRLIAPSVQPSLLQVAAQNARLTIDREPYDVSHIRDAQLVIAATDDADVNLRVAADARRLGRLVNVVDAPESGNVVTPATHVVGDLVIAVSAGGVPGAARRIRDAIAERFDVRYGRAIAELATMRRRLLRDGARERWRKVSDSVLDGEFCDRVERGELAEGMAPWH